MVAHRVDDVTISEGSEGQVVIAKEGQPVAAGWRGRGRRRGRRKRGRGKRGRRRRGRRRRRGKRKRWKRKRWKKWKRVDQEEN